MAPHMHEVGLMCGFGRNFANGLHRKRNIACDIHSAQRSIQTSFISRTWKEWKELIIRPPNLSTLRVPADIKSTMREELPKKTPPPRVAESLDLEDEPVTENLSALLEQAAKNYPNNVAVVSLHQEDPSGDSPDDVSVKPLALTFDSLRSRSLELAHYLVSKGVRPGDRFVTLLYNQAEWAICFWAAAYAGCVFVPLDPRSMARREEASHLLGTANASAFVVATSQIAASVGGILDRDVNVGLVVDSSDGATPEGWSTLDAGITQTVHERLQPSDTVTASDPAIMFFTSGTSALPKACPQSSINIATPALALAKRTDVDPTSSVCQHLPSFHVFSVVLSLSLWLNGGRVVFPSATFDPAASIKAIELSPRVSVPCVPLMLQAIANLPSRPQALPSLHCIIMGGAPLSSQAMELAKGLKPTWLAMGYGLSEGVVTLVDVQKGDIARTRSNGDVSSGHAVSGSKIRICAPGSRTPLLRGELGELHQGGPAVFDGYLGIESSSCYKDEGISWLATGDQAYMDDDGYIYFLGRYKDLIIRGGENISPEKIEEYLFKQQNIVVQVVGVPDELAGEIPVAVSNGFNGEDQCTDELKKAVHYDLGAAYAPFAILDLQKHLKRDAFPTTVSGKIQKNILKEWVAEYMKNASPASSGPGIDTAAPTTSQLRAFWADISGLQTTDISLEVSVHSFTDSMMLVQFCALVFKVMRKHITMQELHQYTNIELQAKFLDLQQPIQRPIEQTSSPSSSPFYTLSQVPVSEERVKKIETSANARLQTLGMTLGSVDQIVPATDLMTMMGRGGRQFTFNQRHSMYIQGKSLPDLKQLMRQWIADHPLLRTMVIDAGLETDYYLVMRTTDMWMAQMFRDGETIDSVEDVKTHRLGENPYDFVATDGPLFRLTFLPVRDSDVVGLVIHMHHNMFDGISLQKWYNDLMCRLTGRTCALGSHPYQDWAAQYHAYRDTAEAAVATKWHVDRLRGISAAKNKLWPVQRSPQWFKGPDDGWTYKDGRPGELGARERVDGDNSVGTMGVTQVIDVPAILALRAQHGISPPMVAKAACALFNMYTMKCDEAIFASVESGRKWPLEKLPGNHTKGVNVLEIDGPTMTTVVNRIKVGPWETAKSFMLRIQVEQIDIDRYADAPLAHILKGLRETPETGEADAELTYDLLQRQVYDWLPRISERLSSPAASGDEVKEAVSFGVLELTGRSDLGVVVFPTMPADGKMSLEVTWDDTQMGLSEANTAASEFLNAIAWLADPVNLEEPVRNCEFSKRAVTHLQGSGSNTRR